MLFFKKGPREHFFSVKHLIFLFSPSDYSEENIAAGFSGNLDAPSFFRQIASALFARKLDYETFLQIVRERHSDP